MIQDIAKQLLDIMSTVSHRSVKELRSRSRRTPLPVCRGLIYYELRLRGYSTQAIGDEFNRNHATVLHGCKMISGGLKKNGYSPDEIEIERRFLDALEDSNMV